MKLTVTPIRFSFALVASCSLALAGCHLNFSMVDGYTFTRTGETAESSETGLISDGIAQIDVQNRFGNIKIETAAGEPGWKWDAKVWADSQELADLLIDELVMDVQTDGNQQSWEVILPEPTSDLNGIESNLTLMLPSDVKVTLTNAHGNVSASNLDSKIELENRHGNVELTNLKGELDARHSHGDLTASQVSESKIKVSHGDLRVNSAFGNVNLVSSHGRVEAEQINGDLTVDGSHSKIKVDQVEANGEFSTSHDKIVATNILGNVTARNSHGSTRIETTGDSVSIRSSHGDIELSMNSQSFRKIDLKTSHASIRASLPAGSNPMIDMEASHGDCKSDMESTSGSGQRVTLRTSHGDIRVTESQVLAEAVAQQ